MVSLEGTTLSPYTDLHTALVTYFGLPRNTNLIKTDKRGNHKLAKKAFVYYVKLTADEPNEYIAVILGVSLTSLFSYARDWYSNPKFEEVEKHVWPHLPGNEN